MADQDPCDDRERVSRRLHLLLSRCYGLGCYDGTTASIDVDKVTQKFMSAWAKGGRLRELERAMEQEAWLVKEVSKVVGATASKRQRDTASSDMPRRSERPKVTYAARHILIKCAQSRKPVSRRTNESTAGVSAEAAAAELASIRERIVAEGASEQVFARFASDRSDCSSFARGGDLGEFAAGKMQRVFEEATRVCEVGDISPIVLSDSGYHLIWRYK